MRGHGSLTDQGDEESTWRTDPRKAMIFATLLTPRADSTPLETPIPYGAPRGQPRIAAEARLPLGLNAGEDAFHTGVAIYEARPS